MPAGTPSETHKIYSKRKVTSLYNIPIIPNKKLPQNVKNHNYHELVPDSYNYCQLLPDSFPDRKKRQL